MNNIIFLLTTSLLLVVNCSIAQNKMAKFEKLNLEIYPKPKDGYKQLYIQLPVEKNENNLKVELFVGKNDMVDCNTYGLLGSIKIEKTADETHLYYVVESDGSVVGTQKACLDNKKTSQYIQMPTQMVNYNSKTPIVVYVPENLEVKYKIWRADKNLLNAKSSIGENSLIQPPMKIPYKMAENYFVKNTYADKDIHAVKITSQQELEKIFGMATTAGQSGKPAPVDFSKEYIIACIAKESNKNTSIDVINLDKTDEKLVLTYNINEREIQYFTSRNAILIIVNKQYQGEIILNQIR